MLSWWTWTWWETIVVVLLAIIASNTLFTGTEDQVNLKGEFYFRDLPRWLFGWMLCAAILYAIWQRID